MLCMRPLLTTAEAADLLGVHRSTITRRVANGELKPVYRGNGARGPMLFDPADLEAVTTNAS